LRSIIYSFKFYIFDKMSGYQKIKTKHIKEFNSIIFDLFRILVAKFPKNDSILVTKRRLNLAIDACESVAIDTAGVYLYKYREQIMAKNKEYFMNETWIQSEKIKDPITLDLIKLIMSNMNNIDNTEEDLIHNNVKKLLTIYKEYKLM